MSARLLDPIIDIYCRISVDYDGTLRSVESQEEDCRDALAEDHPQWQIGKVWRDHAKSAWSPKTKRPEFEAMMARLESGEAQGVMVYDLTRFTRKPMEGERLIALAQRGIIVTSITQSYDLMDADQRANFRTEMVAAAKESDKTSQRGKRGKHKKALKGKSLATRRGFARPGFLPNPKGWEPGDARVRVPADQLAREQAAVRDLAQRVLAGESMAAIAAEWNEAKLYTTNGCRWSGADLRQMLVSPSIAGLVAHNGVVVAKSVEGEPALSEEVWDRLMLYFGSRKRGRNATTYVLSGLVRCGRCGGPLYGRPMKAKAPYADGEVRREYMCLPKPKQETGCGRLAIDQRHADAMVRAHVIEVLSDPRHTDALAQMEEHRAAQRATLLKELAALNEEADALAAKTGTTGWSLARVDAAMVQYGTRIEEVERALKGIGADEVVEGDPIVDAAADWDGGTVAERRALLKRAFPTGLKVMPCQTRGKARSQEDRIKVIE